jgi:sugar phosphate isomerase/epimerase
MRLPGAPRLGHLTYCTNIHAGESWPEVLAGLETHLPAIKAAVAPEAPLGVGLRLSAAAAEALAAPATFEAFRAFLEAGGYYVFTINGFPYGAFHGQPVKEGAYRPDWSDPARLAYSDRLADLLARLLPEGLTGTVSTVPGTFKPWAEGAAEHRLDAIVRNLVEHAAHLVALEARSGKRIVLALEPEPCCLLETIAETVEFFETRLFGADAVRRLSALCGLDAATAEAALRRHLGVCYDVCHAAVEFEDPRASIAALQGAGIEIAKVQLSAALKIRDLDDDDAQRLRPFDEPVYLHQVVARARDGALERYLDLPEALARLEENRGKEWRIHFHVPIFLEQLEAFSTTQDFLRQVLALHRAEPVTEHLEVETYTWDVLPAAQREVAVSAAIARELNWVRERLAT